MSVPVHTLVWDSYLAGGFWYPVDCGNAFTEHLFPTVTVANGEARTGVKVETLLTNDGKIVGLYTSEREDVLSDDVISNIGVVAINVPRYADDTGRTNLDDAS
ncbi:hypothetical protein [Ruegeria arenilitoris]|uniref:hypothetical protein n=1 Tax=Ruegeria arenilitoris TaxID=1173585 RepID=UPI00147C4194|nr:hypothetical protein [Ruegeria arenilitoris]